MALQLFMNDLMLSQGEILVSFDIVVVDDNARSLAQPPPKEDEKEDALLFDHTYCVQHQDESSIQSRWGGDRLVGRRDSDPVDYSSFSLFSSTSSKRAAEPVERRAPCKTKSDSTLTIPQRLASPFVPPATRKRIRSVQPIKMVEDDDTRTSSLCSQVPPQLPRRFQSPHVPLKDRKTMISVTTKEHRGTTTSKKSHQGGNSIAILDAAFLMIEEESLSSSPPDDDHDDYDISKKKDYEDQPQARTAALLKKQDRDSIINAYVKLSKIEQDKNADDARLVLSPPLNRRGGSSPASFQKGSCYRTTTKTTPSSISSSTTTTTTKKTCLIHH